MAAYFRAKIIKPIYLARLPTFRDLVSNKYQMKNYTPATIDDIVFQSAVEEKKIRNIINGKMSMPSNGITGIILHGATGTGKTMLAKLLPHAIEQNKPGGCAKPYVSWHDCEAPNNGVQLINSIRTEISHVASSGSGLHYIVFNEADNLTPSALRQLKTVMETPNTIFIFTTNEVGAFAPALRNRCEEISFNPTDPSIWLPRLRHVLQAEQATGSYNDKFLESIVKTSNFSGRHILKQMQSLIG